MTELTSSLLGAGFDMTLISSERRRVPAMLEDAMFEREEGRVDLELPLRGQPRNEKSTRLTLKPTFVLAQTPCLTGFEVFLRAVPPTRPALAVSSSRPPGSSAS